MTTCKYRSAQPAQIHYNFDNIPSSINQFNEIDIDLRAQRYSNDQSLSNDNKEQASMLLPAKQQPKTNGVRTLNSSDHMIRPMRTNPIIEQPSPPKKRKKHKCTSGCCNCNKNSFCCCCLPSSKQYHRSSHQKQYSSNNCCCCCRYDDQSTCCNCNGEDNSCLECGCCCDGDSCDCDCGDCIC